MLMDQRPGKTGSDNIRITAPSKEQVALSLACWLMDKADGDWTKQTLARRRKWGKLLKEENELRQRIASRIQAKMTKASINRTFSKELNTIA